MHVFLNVHLVVRNAFSADGVSHTPERVKGLHAIRRPETGGEVMHFWGTANWMHTSLPKMAEVVAPLRDFLEKVFYGGKRTKSVAKNKSITEKHWTRERQEPWDTAIEVLRDVVTVAYSKRGWNELMSSEASGIVWDSFLT